MKEVYERKSYTGVMFRIIEKPGNREYKGTAFEQAEAKLYFMQLDDGVNKIEFPYSYKDQFKLLELVMDNIILDGVFQVEYMRFFSLMSTIIQNRKDRKRK